MQLLDEQPDATEGDLHELLRPILRDHFQPALLALPDGDLPPAGGSSHAYHRGNEAHRSASVCTVTTA
jgi:hypothetical protein